jgi:arsenate reductase (glutaredoxin)
MAAGDPPRRRINYFTPHVVQPLPGSDALEVQIFGVKKSADTRKALRFFAERRVKTHFVDLMERSASLGELRRFAQKFGVSALVDRDSRRFDDLGLRYAQLSDERWLEKLSDEPLLLRMPLVRNGTQLTIGAQDATWKGWVDR